jgi:four helix bundle protein
MLQTFSTFRKGSNIAHRLLVFASEVLRVARDLPTDAASKHIALQIMRSATAVGANYEEARAAESAADFIHKVGIANKEMRETLWWLALIDTSQIITANLEAIAREGTELASILTASIRTARKNQEAAV